METLKFLNAPNAVVNNLFNNILCKFSYNLKMKEQFLKSLKIQFLALDAISVRNFRKA